MRGSHSARPCLRGRDDRPTSARVISTTDSEAYHTGGTASSCSLHLLLLFYWLGGVQPSHGSGFRCASGSTPLYRNPALGYTVNDVAHSATFPPAVSQRGGRHYISPHLGRRFGPPIGDICGRSISIVNSSAGCDFRRGSDPLPLYARGDSDVMCSTGRSTRPVVPDAPGPKGLCTPDDLGRSPERNEDPTPAVFRTDGI